MDRNGPGPFGPARIKVALRKESVDRNVTLDVAVVPSEQSLSARRAWIEIAIANTVISCFTSLSARRAWIEIRLFSTPTAWYRVALRKESVDRNLMTAGDVTAPSSRSPQGERG